MQENPAGEPGSPVARQQVVVPPPLCGTAHLRPSTLSPPSVGPHTRERLTLHQAPGAVDLPPKGDRRIRHEPSEEIRNSPAYGNLCKHPFFEGIPNHVIGLFAQAAVQIVFPEDNSRNGILDSRQYHEEYALEADGTLFSQQAETWPTDYLWIVESGTVFLEEAGVRLGSVTAQTGGAFGDVVALGRCESQPFTVKVGKGAAVCWTIPNQAVSQTLKLNQEARTLLGLRVDERIRELLHHRVSNALFLRHCGPKLCRRILGKLQIQYFAPGDYLCKAEDEVDGLLVITCGRALVRVQDDLLLEEEPGSGGIDRRSIVVRRSNLPRVPSLLLATHGTRSSANQLLLPASRRCSDGVESLPSDGDRGLVDGRGFTVTRSLTYDDTMTASATATSALSASSSSSDDSDSDSSASSLDSEGDMVTFPLPEMRQSRKLNPAEERPIAAGDEPMLFGEHALLDLDSQWPEDVVALHDCIGFMIPTADFKDALERHPPEQRRFGHMKRANYLEWEKCQLAHLPTLQVFRGCSKEFLSNVAEVVVPFLYFRGDELLKEGVTPSSLIFLMSGSVKVQLPTGDVTNKIHGPHIFGSFEIFGVSEAFVSCDILADSFCQVLTLEHAELLSVLSRFPNESVGVISRMGIYSANTEGGTKAVMDDLDDDFLPKPPQLGRARVAVGNAGMVNIWYTPFIKSLGVQFYERFAKLVQRGRLMQGQMLFSEGDFLVALLEGSVQITYSSFEDATANGPIIVAGFCQLDREGVRASKVCQVNRISAEGIGELANEFPTQTRIMLDRVMQFQKFLDKKNKAPWYDHAQTLWHHAHLQNCDPFFLREVAEVAKTEYFLPNENIIVEGDPVDSTLILEAGQAFVQKVEQNSKRQQEQDQANKEVVKIEISDGHWMGERALICGDLRRNATVFAGTTCKILRIWTKDFVQILGRFTGERERFRKFAEQYTLTNIGVSLNDFSFFNELDRDFVNFLRPKCISKIFFANEHLLVQGEPADSLFMTGADAHLSVEVDGHRVSETIGRSILGVGALLSKAQMRRGATITALVICATRILSRFDWLDALKNCPNHRRWLDSFAVKQLKKSRESREKSLRKVAWDRLHQREARAMKVHFARRAMQRVDEAKLDASAKAFAHGGLPLASSAALPLEEHKLSWQRGPAPLPRPSSECSSHRSGSGQATRPGSQCSMYAESGCMSSRAGTPSVMSSRAQTPSAPPSRAGTPSLSCTSTGGMSSRAQTPTLGLLEGLRAGSPVQPSPGHVKRRRASQQLNALADLVKMDPKKDSRVLSKRQTVDVGSYRDACTCHHTCMYDAACV
eukprot:TRINITY_DN6344_c0_g1_i2.p1 TRINITY_DN6344_c0_g1~~TRINITY_DN6344_c0_g1_i2.p1  ORF type:complete len:1313 (+),score=235.71 TRINITY_DN6344_c0_g1_i2:232-4170(+)